MGKKYQKSEIIIDYINDDFVYWKKASTQAQILLESYKEKRGISIQVKNLLPSYYLQCNKKGEYQIKLKGKNIEESIGDFHIGPDGSGKLYKRFSGHEIESIEEVVVEAEGELVIKGTNQMAKKVEKSLWNEIFKVATKGSRVYPFSERADETKAAWYVVPFDQNPYGHMALGEDSTGKRFVAFPGRFLKDEQPECDDGRLLLWQPLRGGEEFCTSPEEMDELLVEYIYGYWIGILDKDGNIRAL